MKSATAGLLVLVLVMTGVRLLTPCSSGQCVTSSLLTSVSGLFAGDGGDKQDKKGDKSVKTDSASDSRAASKVVFSKSGFDVTPLSKARVSELAKDLSKEEADVILSKGTERAFCGNLLDNKQDGTYFCRLCGLPLFSSEHKFESGTGWPSFFQPVDPAHLRETQDRAYGMVRTEITCARCDAHLGHVFDDGPKPTGQRHCLNSISLTFVNKKDFDKLPAQSKPLAIHTAYFGGGCFWGIEDRFQQVPGVIDAASGYMGGHLKNPTYKQVCYSDTGHAEVVRVTFYPSRVTYAKLLETFFKIHDPTQVNRQGPDVGSQYRSAIFTASAEQLSQAKDFIAQQQKSPKFDGRGRKIATQVETAEKAGEFYIAEEYHQDYHAKHGGSCAIPED